MPTQDVLVSIFDAGLTAPELRIFEPESNVVVPTHGTVTAVTELTGRPGDYIFNVDDSLVGEYRLMLYDAGTWYGKWWAELTGTQVLHVAELSLAVLRCSSSMSSGGVIAAGAFLGGAEAAATG